MNVQTVDYKDKNARSALATSLRETGFAVLVNHPITPKRINEAYDDWADFFASDSKQDWLFDPEHQDGFFPFKSENAKGASEKDLKEFYHVYSWGRVPDSLNTMTRALYADLVQLGQELLSWLDAEMPADLQAKMTSSLASMMDGSAQSLFRVPEVASGHPRSRNCSAASFWRSLNHHSHQNKKGRPSLFPELIGHRLEVCRFQ